VCQEGLEAGVSDCGRAIAGQPHPYPDKVDGRGCRDMLEMGFCGSHIAGTSDAKGPHSLREGALNPRSLGILCFVGFGLLTLP
jgi:hypothetical protein